MIEVPVFIAFDCDAFTFFDYRALARAAGERTFTMRYDPDTSSDVPAQWCDHYPPRDNAQWVADRDGILFGLFTAKTEKTISERAASDPDSYSLTERAS